MQERLAELEATRLWADWYSTEASLLRAREKELVPQVDTVVGVPPGVTTWRRGFVDTLTMNAAVFAMLPQFLDHVAFRLLRGLRVSISEALRALAHVPGIVRLELTEAPYDPPPDVARDAVFGFSAARDRIEHEASLHRAREHERLAALIPKLPALKELVLATSAPLSAATLATLAKYRGRAGLEVLRLHLGPRNPDELASHIGRGYRKTRLEPTSGLALETLIATETAIGAAYMSFGRPVEAAHRFDDAYAMTAGRNSDLHARHDRAVLASGLRRQYPSDPDPERDGLVHRVPALLRWGQVDRVVAAAPSHVGAWAIKGLRLRDDFDLEGAAAAFARALDGAPNAHALGHAYALMTDDLAGALAVLGEAAPSLEATTLYATLAALQSNPTVTLALLDAERDPIARLVVGLAHRMQEKPARSREVLREQVIAPPNPYDPAHWLVRLFAATLVASEPYALRREFHAWWAESGPHLPRPMLLFDALIRLANKVVPNVQLEDVEREVDRARGA